MKRIPLPQRDGVTGEYRYNNKWYGHYPSEEMEQDEAALDEYWDRKMDRRRDEE